MGTRCNPTAPSGSAISRCGFCFLHTRCFLNSTLCLTLKSHCQGKPCSSPRSSSFRGTRAKRGLKCKQQKGGSQPPLLTTGISPQENALPGSAALPAASSPFASLLGNPSLASATPTPELLARGALGLKSSGGACAALCTTR